MTKTQQNDMKIYIDLYDMLAQMSRRVGQNTQNSLDYTNPDEQFSYIPSYGSHLNDVLKMLTILTLPRRGEEYLRLVDLGCGDGLFIMFVQTFLEHIGHKCCAYGVEINTLIDKVFLERHYMRYGDFFKLNAEYFKDKDIVYMYNPLRVTDKNMELLTMLDEICREGSLILFNSIGDMGHLTKAGWKNERQLYYKYITRITHVSSKEQ